MHVSVLPCVFVAVALWAKWFYVYGAPHVRIRIPNMLTECFFYFISFHFVSYTTNIYVPFFVTSFLPHRSYTVDCVYVCVCVCAVYGCCCHVVVLLLCVVWLVDLLVGRFSLLLLYTLIEYLAVIAEIFFVCWWQRWERRMSPPMTTTTTGYEIFCVVSLNSITCRGAMNGSKILFVSSSMPSRVI